MRASYLFLFVLFALSILAPPPATAAEPEWIGRNGSWNAYSYKDGGQLVCYMASTPVKAQGKYKKRGRIFALVTNRPANSSRAVISIVAGYTYQAQSEVEVTIGKEKYVLFTEKNRAWSPDENTDKKMTRAMIRGNRMVVRGVSSRGTKTKDTYSLKGFTATLRLIDKACKM